MQPTARIMLAVALAATGPLLAYLLAPQSGAAPLPAPGFHGVLAAYRSYIGQATLKGHVAAVHPTHRGVALLLDTPDQGRVRVLVPGGCWEASPGRLVPAARVAVDAARRGWAEASGALYSTRHGLLLVASKVTVAGNVYRYAGPHPCPHHRR